jgi:hypothetical protein
MKSYLVREDIEQWNPLVEWLESRSPRMAAPEAAGVEAVPTTNATEEGAAEPLSLQPVSEGGSGPC